MSTMQSTGDGRPSGTNEAVSALADLLHETAEHHDAFEQASAPHDWWDWYAAYVHARQHGADPAAADAAADRYMAESKGITATRG